MHNHFYKAKVVIPFLGFFLFLLIGITGTARAQYPASGQQNFNELHPDSVIRLNPQMAQMLYEPGEVIVRFRDEVEVNLSDKNGMAQIGIQSVDDILEEHEVEEAGKLIPGAKHLTTKEILTAPTGRQFERPSLHNIYLLRTKSDAYEFFPLIEALEDDPDVLYAEPNYIYTAVGATPMSPALNAEEMQEWLQNKKGGNEQLKNGEGVEPNDPFFDQQWWIEAVNAHLAWEQSTGDTTQVIAIIDTGVDWTHPDLQNKIWTNPNEIENGQDSEANGFVDDIRGWDFINNNNNPMDDNSHGTHVAGIAAAEADNGIGIAGVSWGARIMPVKVLQSSGAGTVANVVQGVNYASENGATVINMSLGSYAYSMALEDALANAYANAVLVAAAGNDGLCIGPDMCKDLRPGRPMYPAAFSFVLGIEASAPFSNYDHDGSLFSAYPDLFNYELCAPGSALVSTIPNGSYRAYSGTSMAAPIVAGGVSIYKSVYPNHSQELMWANLIHKSSDLMDINAALEGLDGSRLEILSHMLVDSLGDGDGYPDAGETIQLWYTLRNTGLQANDVYAGIRLGEFEDTSVVEIIDSISYVGSISPFATRTNEQNPFKIAIADDVVHNRDIVFEAYAYNQGETDTIFHRLILTIQNGEKLSGVMDSTLILTADKIWLVNQSFRIGSNGTLLINPGTQIILNNEVIVRGSVIAEAKKDSLVHVVGPANFSGEGNMRFNYTHFYGMTQQFGSSKYPNSHKFFSNCLFENFNLNSPRILFGWSWGDTIKSSVVKNVNGFGLISASGMNKTFMEKTNIINCYFSSVSGIRHLNIYKNNFVNIDGVILFERFGEDYIVETSKNNFISNSLFNAVPFFKSMGNAESFHIPNQYWGTTDLEKIRDMNIDFWDDPSLPILVYDPIGLQPHSETPGIVWKVVVNGADAQDEFVEPVGVGTQRFDVYFNRPMDIEYTPNVSFGVRYPYNQQAVTDSMSWSADSTIFTAWKTIQLYTGDGINRVRVTGASDPEGFEIPPEYFRFEFLIDAAGAASTNFMATPGMGRVDLSWDDPGELDDFLGYNMYRFEHATDTTFTEPILLNSQLILEPEHTDFDVLPGDKYYYYYKILRTNMAETDSSRVVMGIPHTADPGDSNGDYNVNVIDIVSIVAFMLNQNPHPFIFEAADVNQDGSINVLDIVGVVQLINGSKQGFMPHIVTHPNPAIIHLNEDIIQIESDGQLTAIEFEINTAFPESVSLSSALQGHELAWRRTANGIHGFIFNMQNKTIPKGIIDIIHIQHQNPDLQWGKLLGADPEGKFVEIQAEAVGLNEVELLTRKINMEVFPNPATESINVRVNLPIRSNVEISFIDIYGRTLKTNQYMAQTSGKNIYRLNTHLLHAPGGLVFCRVTATGNNGGFLQETVKIMLIR